MTINFSAQPYFDDFDKNKNFQKVLLKPEFPVQARELNQIQSILHNQTQEFANSIYKQGSRITGNIPKHIIADYVVISDISPFDGLSIKSNRIQNGVLFRGQTSKIEAKLLILEIATQNDPFTLYVEYTKTAIDNEKNVFINGEIVDVIDTNNNITYSFKVLCPDCPDTTGNINITPTGKGVLWQIPDGVYYTKGYFVPSFLAMLIAEKYTLGVESYTIGLDIIESIITCEEDSTLYDNALGYPNYQAPGADRYKIELLPAIRTVDTNDGDNFIVLARVIKGRIVFLNDKTQYSNLMDMLAERTFDESGNYTVVPFKVSLKEHLAKDKNDSKGVYTIEDGGDENKLVAIVSTGKAYVLGYQIKKIVETWVNLDKARDTRKVQTYYNNIGTLNYVLVDIKTNSCFFSTDITKSNLFTDEKINLYDDIITANLPTGNIIGTITPYDIEFVSSNNNVNTYKLYYTNISMNTNKTYDMVKSLYATGTIIFLASSINDPISLIPRIYESDKSCLLWDIGKQNVKSIRNINNSTQSSLTYTNRRKFTATLNGTGQYTWNASSNEYYVGYSPLITLVGVINNDNTTEIITLNGNNITITPTSISVNLGASYSSKTILVIHNVIKTNVQEKIKTLKTQIITNASLNNDDKIISTKADLFKVVSIKSYTPQTINSKVDVIDKFIWTNGQTDIAYTPIVFIKKEDVPAFDVGTLFEITFQYYEHSSDGDYFCVDSYRQIIDDPTLSYAFEDIPKFTSNNGVNYDLKNCLDFRPLMVDTNFIAIQPALNGIYNLDYEMYLPRIDLLVIDKTGEIYQKKGISSDYPVPPNIDVSKEMSLYTIIMNPYVYNINNDIKLNFVENKRYTMRDIGRLDSRISNVEYYTTFTLQESKTADLQVTDSNGNNMFKNGFVVDNFQNYQAADLTNVEFKASLDRKDAKLRPSYEMIHTEFEFDVNNSLGYKKLGNIIMSDYNEELFIQQPYASQDISVNPYMVVNQVGKMVLSPAMDSWADTTVLPSMTISIDTGIAELEKIANSTGLIGTEYGAWSTINETILDSTTIHTENYGDWNRHDAGWLRRQDTIGQTQVRSGVTTDFSSKTTSYDLGSRVTDVKLQPYMRSKEIQFYATNLKPNTKLYCFFDGVNVSEFCRPLTTFRYNTPIISGNSGAATGVFRIPENRFFNGQKTFRLTNTKDNSTDPDLLVTSCEAVFWAGGLDMSVQGTTMNVLTPVITTRPAETQTQFVTTTVQSEPYDPVAQTFTIDEDCYLTGIDVYFSQVDSNDKIFCQVKDTLNGYPGSNILTEVNMSPTECNVSNNSLTPTRIKFPYPIFVQAKKDYSVIVGGVSPDTRLYVSKMGGYDLLNPSYFINKQPSTGSLFKSQNNSTWTADQNLDLKFNLYRAKFKSTSLNLSFVNKPFLTKYKGNNIIETETGETRVRIYLKNHGCSVNDKIKLDIADDLSLNVIESSGTLNVGQTISTLTGNGIITDVSTTQNGTVDVTLKNITGYFLKSQAFTAQSYTPNITDNYLLTNYIKQGVALPTINVVSGTINQDFRPNFNGYNIEELNNELTIIEIDSNDSVIVELNAPATTTGKTGGVININVNKTYSMFNVSGSVTANNCEGSWNLKGIGHSVNSLFTNSNYVRQDDKLFNLGVDTYLAQPYKLISQLNETLRIAGSKSIILNANFTSKTEYDSPIINLDTLSLVGVSNIIDNNTELTYNVSPNATNRLIQETHYINGTSSFKYVTQIVYLKNPAMDMKIILNVYKQQDSDFDLYIKTTSSWDNININDKSWTLITGYNKNFISKDYNDFVEIDMLLSEIMPTEFGTNEYNNFRFKIVGKSKNPANPPLFSTLRIIALT